MEPSRDVIIAALDNGTNARAQLVDYLSSVAQMPEREFWDGAQLDEYIVGYWLYWAGLKIPDAVATPRAMDGHTQAAKDKREDIKYRADCKKHAKKP